MTITDKDLFISDTPTPEEIASIEGDDSAENNADVAATEEQKVQDTPEVKVDNTPEVKVEDTPAQAEPTDGGNADVPSADNVVEDPEPSKDKSMSEILDELEASQTSVDEKQKEIEKTTEEIKDAENKGENTSELIEKLQQQVVEMNTEKKKSDVTIDFLQQQVESLHKENVQYKYGRVDEDGVMSLIDNDPELKSIVSQTIKSSDNPQEKEKLVGLYKSQLEKLTGLDFSSFMEAQNKKIEGEMSDQGSDVATNVEMGTQDDKLFV